MMFLFDAISASVHYAHYKIFEVDWDVYFAHTRSKWKDAMPPTDFYIAKVNWQWQSDVPVADSLLDDIVTQLEQYLRNRTLDDKKSDRPGWLQ